MEEVPYIDDEQTQKNRVRRVLNIIKWVWIGANALLVLTGSWPLWQQASNGEFGLSLGHLSTFNQCWAYPVVFSDMIVLLVMGFWFLFRGPDYIASFWNSYAKTGSFRIWREELVLEKQRGD